MTSENHPNKVAGMFTRRRILGLALTIPLLTFTKKASATYIPTARSLNVYSQNSGESFRGVYFENGRYLPDALGQLNRLMRDSRSGSVIQIDPELFDLLANLSDLMPSNGPIELISGFRTVETNRAARRQSRRVARNSLHMQGKAADVVIPGYSVRQMRQAAISLQAGGVGSYRRSRFIHVDTGPVRSW